MWPQVLTFDLSAIDVTVLRWAPPPISPALALEDGCVAWTRSARLQILREEESGEQAGGH